MRRIRSVARRSSYALDTTNAFSVLRAISWNSLDAKSPRRATCWTKSGQFDQCMQRAFAGGYNDESEQVVATVCQRAVAGGGRAGGRTGHAGHSGPAVTSPCLYRRLVTSA